LFEGDVLQEIPDFIRIALPSLGDGHCLANPKIESTATSEVLQRALSRLKLVLLHSHAFREGISNFLVWS